MSRYLVAQPKNLKSLSMTNIGKWVALQAEKLMPYLSKLYKLDPNQAENILSRQIEAIRRHIEHELLGKYHNELAINVMHELVNLIPKSGYIQKTKTSNVAMTLCVHISKMKIHIITRMVETIFTNKLTSLSFMDKSFDLFHQPLNSNSHLLTGLICLNLNLKCTKKDTEIISLLEKFSKLRFLRISNVCTNNILQCVAMHCTFIEVLRIPVTDLNNTISDVNDLSIKIISEISTLKYIDINNTKVTKIGISDLFLTFPKLEHINISNHNLISAGIQRLVAYRLHVGKQFHLKSYGNSGVKYRGQINLLVNLCPWIEEIYFQKKDFHRHLRPISELQYLRKLVLLDYDFYSDHIKELLEARGSNLSYLYLKSVRELDLNALIHICQNCPYLETLKLIFCYFTSPSTENNQINTKRTVTFAHLKKLIIGGNYENDAPNDEHLYFLLSNCPRIEFIDFCGFVYDPVMIDILNKCPSNLAHIKVLMTYNNLGMFVIDRIVRNCINPPNVLGPSPLH